MAVLFCALPFAELPRAAAKSNASALTYKTGTYTTLKA